MFKNYFKIAIRQFTLNKGFSIINVMGLAIGIAVSIIGFLYVLNEISYDRFHEKSDRIHRIAVEGMSGTTELYQTQTAAAYTIPLYDEFPEIEKIARIATWDFQFRAGENSFIEKDVFVTDSTFFDIFTIKVVKGQKENLFNEPYTAVLTEGSAKRYFGEKDPINQVIVEDSKSYRVIAVVEEFPQNSHFHFNVAVSLISFDGKYNNPSWWSNNYVAYLLLNKSVDYKKVESRFPAFIDKYLFDGNYTQASATGDKWEMYLQPLASIHLNSDIRGEFEANGKKEYVYIFLIVSISILILACINFINLSTARSEKRAKEVGVKKVVGSSKTELIKQFVGESVILSFVSLFIALSLVELTLIYLPDFTGIKLQIPYFTNIYAIPLLLALGLVVGVLSGTYPALVMSSFKPIYVLKGGKGSNGKTSWFRNSLVIFQFVISIVLIIGTFVISSQLDLLQNKNLGFDKEEVIIIKNASAVRSSIQVVKNEIKSLPFVQNVGISSCLPGISMSTWGFKFEGNQQGFNLNVFYGDEDLLDVLKLEMDKGRYFSREYGTDTTAIVLNEEAAKLIGYDEILSRKIDFYRDPKLQVIGVVKNIRYESKHQKVHPMAIMNMNTPKASPRYITVKVIAGDYKQIIKSLTTIWDKYSASIPIDYTFLDKQYDSLYNNEMQTKKLFLAFSFLAIFIACLGLLGLASFMAQQKTKEIGIRKTFGASIWTITLLLSKNFTKWVVIANIIAWPLAWYFFDNWLNNFEERCQILWWYFVLAALISFVIAWGTVSYQTLKSASANPIDALRYE